MAKNKGDSTSFWVSYADLMTSLFFVMLVLVVVFTSILREQLQKSEEMRKATEAQIEKITELEQATQDIDPKYLSYDSEYKKFVLNVPIQFGASSANMADLSETAREQLRQAGRRIYEHISRKHKEIGASFIVIIEGQASSDSYIRNNELSYARALALRNFWHQEGIQLERHPGCELVVAGAGVDIGSKPRSQFEQENQRFLVTIINKPGLINR